MKLPKGLNEWLRDGERGVSSEAIVSHLTGINILEGRSRGWDYPHDPDDFRRCVLLLDAVPYCRRNFAKMKSRGKVWSELVDNWLRLHQLFREEAHTGACPKLYKAMEKLGC